MLRLAVLATALAVASTSAPSMAREVRSGVATSKGDDRDAVCARSEGNAWKLNKVSRVGSCGCERDPSGEFNWVCRTYAYYDVPEQQYYQPAPNPYAGMTPGTQSNGDQVFRGVQ